MNGLSNFIATLAGWIVAAIAATGYIGIIGLMALESACIPLPSEIIMPFSGYLVSTGRLDLWLVAIAGAIGCNLGSALAYEAGRRGGRPMVARYGRWLLLTSEDLDRSERFFDRFGGAAVLIGRMMPGIRSFIALPAGIADAVAALSPLHVHRITALVPGIGLCRPSAREPLEHGPAIVGLVSQD